MILAGDIGGTKTILALFEEATAAPVVEATCPSGEHAGLDEIVHQFVTEQGQRVKHACFGIAGPVRDGRSEATNLPWVVDARHLAGALSLPAVTLINDLEATAYGLAALGDQDVVVLQPGAPGATGNRAVIAAGTGLGQAGLYWDGQRHRPFATEGGHTDFAPSNELEDAFLRWLRTRWEHVSWERVLSGPGLHNIFQFLRDTRTGEEATALVEEMRAHDPAAAISRAAMEGRSALAQEALDLFVALYGAQAGNLALTVMSTGGLYVGGGIAPKIMPRLTDGTFIQRFTAKGRMRPLLEAMPVRVVLDEKVGLRGAALAAVGLERA
jgi:glucokinase